MHASPMTVPGNIIEREEIKQKYHLACDFDRPHETRAIFKQGPAKI